MNPAFREDAPPELARARERQLQGYRERLAFVPGSGETQSALRWIAELASTGHVGAERLLARTVDIPQLLALHRAAPAFVEELAQIQPWCGQRLAFALDAGREAARARQRTAAARARLAQAIADSPSDDADRALVKEWLAAGFPPWREIPPICLRIGGRLEAGAADPASGLALALVWYRVGLPEHETQLHGGMALDGELCEAVARRFDPRLAERSADLPQVALAWYQRGLQVGHPGCMAGWLQRVLEPAGAAPESVDRVEDNIGRFLAACTLPPRERWLLSDGVRALLAAARRHEAGEDASGAARRCRQLADRLDPHLIDIPR